jgi:DNA-binding PadR family transcriptional regulator
VPKKFFRHGELQLVLLALLAERPRHGYDVMAELGRLFAPAYRPSPGSVYPAMEALEAEGLLERSDGDGRTTYRITPVGTQALQDRGEMLAAVEVRKGVRLRPLDSFEPMLERFKVRLSELSGRVDPEALAAVLDRAAVEIERLNGSPKKRRRA